MLRTAAAIGLVTGLLATTTFAQEDRVPAGVPHLDHVFLVMMENHGYQQVINNPNEPYLNGLISSGKVNLATNYFAVGHPSSTNYLEIVGGSNFGVRSDNPPDWGNTACTPNIASGVVNADSATAPIAVETGNVCPISGSGTDAATPAVDTWNEIGGPFVALADLDGAKSVPAAPTVGKSIGDQLASDGKGWKSYQESLPVGSVFGVNYSNGTSTNLSNFSILAPLTASASVVQLYAVKHNPFAYFRSVQEGNDERNSLANVVGFDGQGGLYSDLATGDVPALAFIVPNQCDDQHGRSNADAYCAFDYGQNNSGYTYGTQAGLNPGLIQQGDTTIERLVNAIHASPAWRDGHNAIVIVWDENDYSGSTTILNGVYPIQNQNRVVLTVETNYSKGAGIQSPTYYTSFSLLKSLEAGFGLPCLNHACDSNVQVMSDLFVGNRDHK